MKYRFVFILCVFLLTANLVNAFSNSLDKENSGVGKSNSFSSGSSQPDSFKTPAGLPYNPKEHTGFEHQNKNFPNPTMNDTRYNSNCQFGMCTPGGLNPNNK